MHLAPISSLRQLRIHGSTSWSCMHSQKKNLHWDVCTPHYLGLVVSQLKWSDTSISQLNLGWICNAAYYWGRLFPKYIGAPANNINSNEFLTSPLKHVIVPTCHQDITICTLTSSSTSWLIHADNAWRDEYLHTDSFPWWLPKFCEQLHGEPLHLHQPQLQVQDLECRLVYNHYQHLAFPKQTIHSHHIQETAVDRFYNLKITLHIDNY
jgi:hypothetical protein